MADLTHNDLLGMLSYDPKTGFSTWLDRPDIRAHLNIRHKGTRAGSSVKGKYWRVQIDKKSFRAHRLAHFYMTGVWPDQEIDHIDGNGFNNAWKNLRRASSSENKWNMKKPVTNKSGYKGVSFRKWDGKWIASIRCGLDRPLVIGAYDTPEAAAVARVAAAERLHGSFVRHE